MKFNKMRIQGFKSFVDPVEFHIHNGLTGVVGPNGCGKSNLVEALRWAMGENSYKNMRASGMDDVIFSGSGNRPARNTAEVVLFLDNAGRTAPAAFNDAEELQVSRRIERESGSLYRINGREARARDVQLLFADASTGARSPSMVGQGKIGELIAARPQTRRALLEEAAGISGLHSRRHEAELRLKSAESNLERLEDVFAQLQSQMESLKRQARQARRYKNLSAEIRRHEALMCHLRWDEAKAAEGKAKSDLAAASEAVAGCAKVQANAAKEQAVLAHQLPRLREKEAEAAAVLQRLKIGQNRLQEESARLAERKRELQSRLAQLADDCNREQQLAADNAGDLARLDAEEKGLQERLKKLSKCREEADLLTQDAVARLCAHENDVAGLTSELAGERARKAQLAKNLAAARERQARLKRQLATLEAGLASLAEEMKGMADPAVKRQQEADLEAQLGEAEEAVLAAERAASECAGREQEARKPLDEARGALNQLEGQIKALARLLAEPGGEAFAAIVGAVEVEAGF